MPTCLSRPVHRRSSFLDVAHQQVLCAGHAACRDTHHRRGSQPQRSQQQIDAACSEHIEVGTAVHRAILPGERGEHPLSVHPVRCFERACQPVHSRSSKQLVLVLVVVLVARPRPQCTCAPGACIGQIHKALCFPAGQIGLQPDTMALVSGGLSAETAQVCVQAVVGSALWSSVLLRCSVW
jgi:hypothetical protein